MSDRVFKTSEQIADEARIRASHQRQVEMRLQGYDDLSVGQDDMGKKLAETRRALEAKISYLSGQLEELARSISVLESKLAAREQAEQMEDRNEGGWL